MSESKLDRTALGVAPDAWIRYLEVLDPLSTQGVSGERFAPQTSASPEQSSAVHDASATLLQQLAPQECAAVLLKEIFDLSLEEIADVLATTTGAVKAALHRGRERLRDSEEAAPPRHEVSRAVVDRFVEHYNQRDLPALLAIMLDGASIDMRGAESFVGRKAFGRERGWFYFNFHSFDGKPSPAQWEVVMFEGEPIVLVLSPREGEMRVTSVMRVETDAEHVTRLLVYAMCPDTIREVAARLGRSCAAWNLYHLPREILAMLNKMSARPA